ncbi:MAG: hypothetical protein GTN78_03880, partial [Gemmatimonadales bacterium]|nr:hypothetical protein [Gemmatimonadales bacterium]
MTARALAVGFLLVPFNTFFLVRLNYAWGGTASGVLFQNTISLLLLLALLNRGLKRWRPG